MPQTIDFFLVMFCAGAFCMFLMLGLFLCLHRKPLSSPLSLQKLSGTILLLLALHVLYLTYEQFVGGQVQGQILSLCVVILDVVVLATSLYFIIRRKPEAKESQTSSLPAQEKVVEESKAEVTPLVSPVIAEQPATPLESAEKALADTEEDDSIKEIVTDDAPEETEEIEPIEEPNLDDMIFFQKVESLMAQKRLFCESELSRDDVAAAIGTNRTYLTRSIKSATGKTFLEYITGLRLCYAATLLTTTDEPLDVIGSMVGFRSKSSYYRAFAATYGCTPSEYRKR